MERVNPRDTSGHRMGPWPQHSERQVEEWLRTWP